MRAIHDTEFPNSVEATQRLLDEQGADYDNLKVWFNSDKRKYIPGNYKIGIIENRMRFLRQPDTVKIYLMILKPKMKAPKNFQNVLAMWAQRNGKNWFCSSITSNGRL